MKTRLYLLVGGMSLAALGTGLGQTDITIINQPQNQTNVSGTTATFTVEATGTAPLTYQWQHAFDLNTFVDRPEGTNATLVIPSVQSYDAGNYRVIITNVSGSVTSAVARLYAVSPPSIRTQPTNWPVVSLGMSVTNRVVASSSVTMTYQWRLNGEPLANQTKTVITLTNVQVRDAGNYDVVVANMFGSVTSRVTTLTVDTTFTKFTRGAIVEDSEPSGIPAWGDFDNDGLLDLFVPNNSGNYQNALYLNFGNDEFVRVTNALTMSTGRTWGAMSADVDNDGDLDVFINRPFSDVGYPNNPAYNTMFENQGCGVFTRLTNAVTRAAGFWTDAAFVDHDRDGWLDLFLTTQRMATSQSFDDYFFRNLTDGTFAPWTTNEVGVVLKPQSATAGPGWCDIDGDGDLDLYVSKVGARTNFLYRNDNGVLLPVKAGSLPAARSTWAAIWGDFNNDGLFDLFTGGENGTNMLHLNRGNWVFEDATVASGLVKAGTLYTVSAGDFDNDGDLDLYVPFYDATDVLYVNRGDGTFDPANLGGLLSDGAQNTGMWVDYDNDGFLDLFQACGDLTPMRNLLYRNSLPQYGNTNHWLKLILQGRASNASAIGARVLVNATITGKPGWQIRQVTTGCLTPFPADGMRSHFGLGDATNATTVRIEWPSGIVQELQHVAANQILTVVEHQEYAGPPPAFAGATAAAHGLELAIVEPAAGAVYVLEGSTDLANWSKLLARTSTGGTFTYADTQATHYTQRFYRVVVP